MLIREPGNQEHRQQNRKIEIKVVYEIEDNNSNVFVSAGDAVNLLVSTPTYDEWNNEEIPKHQQQRIYKLYTEHQSNGKPLEVTLKSGQKVIISEDSTMIMNDLSGAITFTNVYEKGKLNMLQDVQYNTNGGKMKIKFSPISTFAKREAILLGKSHPNLETINEVSEATFDENTLVIVSSWCEYTLDGAVHHFPSDMTCHQKVLRDLLKGIKKMHSNGIALRNISQNNVCLNPDIPVLDETTQLNVLKEGKFVAMLTDFAAIKPNRRMMVTQKLMSEESWLYISDEEIYKKLIVNVEHPTQKQWENFDLKCFIKLGIDMYCESDKSPGEARDINVALKDFNDLILNEEGRPISIELLSKHLLLMTDNESHDLVYKTVSALGFKGWQDKYSPFQLHKIKEAGKYLLENGFKQDWRDLFKNSIKCIKPGFLNDFPFGGKTYRHFMSFAFILYSHHDNCPKLKGVLNTYFIHNKRLLDTPERITKYLTHYAPRLRKFCVLVQDII